MWRLSFLRVSAALLLVVQLIPWHNAHSAPVSSPSNVLLMVVDDLRPELAAYGFNHSSPNIQDFAKTAALFNSAYCQYSICAPSRSSFLTGLRPQTTQVFDLNTYFRSTPGLDNAV
eukprot:scpid104675/ scgid29134/ Iduronate 2-sulfatase; Alpha-L-iduronate sulfate sulfatase